MTFKQTANKMLLFFFAFFILVSSGKSDSLLPDLDVPYEPTHPQVVSAMLSLAEVSASDIVYDLGCGDGRIVVTAVKKFGAKKGVGIDLDPRRIREANDRAEGYSVQDRVRFIEGDIMDSDISEATVVAMYLLNTVNLMVRPKLFMELKPGTRIVSHAFHMSEWSEDRLAYHESARNKSVYYWVIPAHAGGSWVWETRAGSKKIETEIILTQKFQRVTGYYNHGNAKKTELVKPVLEGKELRFSAVSDNGGEPFTIEYRGIVEGDSISGTQTWLKAEGHETYPWEAKRGPVDLYGKWNISHESRMRSRDGVLDVSLQGKQITAAYTVKNTREIIPVPQIYVWGGSIYFSITVPGSEEKLFFSGSLSGRTGEGTMNDEMRGPEEYSWKARRVK